MTPVLSLLVLGLAPVAWAADCPDSNNVSLDQLDERLAAVEAVTREPEFDGQAFGRPIGALQKSLPCLSEVISATHAARTHLALMFKADPLGDNPHEGVRVHALRAKSLDGELSLADGMLPPNHGHRAFLKDLVVSNITAEVARPSEGRVFFDGATGLQRPTDAATIFQRVDAAGIVLESRLLLPDTELPAYDAYVEPVALKTSGGGTQTVLLATSIGSGVAAGGLWAGSYVAYSAIDKNPNKPNEGAASAATGMGYGAIALGGIALGTAIGALTGGGR